MLSCCSLLGGAGGWGEASAMVALPVLAGLRDKLFVRRIGRRERFGALRAAAAAGYSDASEAALRAAATSRAGLGDDVGDSESFATSPTEPSAGLWTAESY